MIHRHQSTASRSGLWPLAASAALGIVSAVVAPGIARSVRAWVRQRDRDVAATPEQEDDRRWEIIRPFAITIADALARGDEETARAAARAAAAAMRAPRR